MESILINNVAVPIYETDPARFVAPDLCPAWDYYPNFLRHTDDIMSPAAYLNSILAKVKPTGAERDQLLRSFCEYTGDFLTKMEEYHRMWESLKTRRADQEMRL